MLLCGQNKPRNFMDVARGQVGERLDGQCKKVTNMEKNQAEDLK